MNNNSIEITTNLYLALLHLRSPTREIALWVDAISINQNDEEERNSQVSLMSFTFARAQAVVAWLGLKHTGNDDPAGNDSMFNFMTVSWENGKTKHLSEIVTGEKTSFMSGSPSEETLYRIAASTYWTRLWVVQEICLCKELFFVFGSDLWSFDKLQQSAEECGKQRYSSTRPVDLEKEDIDYRAMLKLFECRAQRYSIMRSFERLIETFRMYKCRNIVDRIYGLMGMAYDVQPVSSSESTIDPIVDYLCSLNLDQAGIAEAGRGRGFLRVNYSITLYELWLEVIKFAYFRAKSFSLRLAQTIYEEQERRVTVVRTAGLIQTALDQRVEDDPLLLPKVTVCLFTD